MAESGYYRRIKSTNSKLEVKRAGTDHTCAGVFVERGQRPGPFGEAWMLARTKRCEGTIRQGAYYIANRLLPHFWPAQKMWENWTPLCMHCAVEVYGDYLEGDLKIECLRPVSPEVRKEIQAELADIIKEMDPNGGRRETAICSH